MEMSFNPDDLFDFLKKGDDQAVNWLINQNKKRLLSLAGRFTRNKADAQDLVQETFIQFWIQRDMLVPGDNVVEILYKILINFVAKHKASEENIRIAVNIYTDLPPLADDLFVDFIVVNEIDIELHRCVKALSPQQKSVLILSVWENRKFSEIAALLNTSTKTIKTQKHRALLKLARKMKIFYSTHKIGNYLISMIVLLCKSIVKEILHHL